MKQLEEKIKDRLEGYESNLPEGDFSEFKTLLDKPASKLAGRRTEYPFWLVTLAVAAGLALVVVLGLGPQKTVTDDNMDSSALVADAIEATESDLEDVIPNPDTKPVEEIQSTDPRSIIAEQKTDEHVEIEPVVTVTEGSGQDETVSDGTVSDGTVSDGTVPEAKRPGATETEDNVLKWMRTGESGDYRGNNLSIGKMKIGHATAVVLGGTGLLGLANVFQLSFGADKQTASYENKDSFGIVYKNPGSISDVRIRDYTHYLPLHSGLSVRVPFSERWSVTTGADYLWFLSSTEYLLSGNHKQNVHYLSIPVRTDFTIARNRWMDVYVGAGMSADFCIAAFDNGQKIDKDGIGFSIIAIGGIQFNISKQFCLFIDPTFSWSIPSDSRVLETYRTDHKLMFSVSSGLRFNMLNLQK